VTLEALKALASNPKNRALMTKKAQDDAPGHLFIGRPGCCLCGALRYHCFDMDPSEGFGNRLLICPSCIKKVLE
jgi:hypothetical protein